MQSNSEHLAFDIMNMHGGFHTLLNQNADVFMNLSQLARIAQELRAQELSAGVVVEKAAEEAKRAELAVQLLKKVWPVFLKQELS